MAGKVYDEDGKRYFRCDCGRVGMVKWSTSDDMAKEIEKYALCPDCRTDKKKLDARYSMETPRQTERVPRNT